MLLLHTNADYLTGLRLSLMRHLTEAGVEVVAFAPNMSAQHAQALRGYGIRGETYDIDATGMNPLRDLSNLWRMRALIRREQPQLVLSNNAKPVIWGTLAAWLARVPRRYCLVGGLGYAFVTAGGATTGRRRFAKRVMSLLYALAFRSATGVIFQNPDDRDELVRSRVCPAGKAHVVAGSGVETDLYSPVEPAVVAPVYVMVGRLVAEKGVREFLQAASKVKKLRPQAQFLLVGEPDGNPSALNPEEIAPYVDAGIVEWPGAVRDVAAWLRRASVFVLPSFYREGVPRSALEAMSCGLPIVTTDAPGCRETVREGRNGILVPVTDVDALVGAILRLCDDGDLRRRMGHESRQLALEKFDARAVNREMARIMGVPPAGEGTVP